MSQNRGEPLGHHPAPALQPRGGGGCLAQPSPAHRRSHFPVQGLIQRRGGEGGIGQQRPAEGPQALAGASREGQKDSVALPVPGWGNGVFKPSLGSRPAAGEAAKLRAGAGAGGGVQTPTPTEP